MVAATSLGPTPFWYATRGSGYTALVLLTASVVLGLVTSVRWASPRWPRFVSQSLHRNLSLFVVVFLLVHIVTSIVDPFAKLSVRDAIIPAGAGYRPLWLGLGVIGTELFAAIVVTSLLRNRMPFGLWRAVHLLAYASWPVAVLHAVGTGTDTKAVWALLLVLACVAAVVLTLLWRLSQGWPSFAVPRAAAMGVSIAAVAALATWTVTGPLQPGWAALAGTPANLLNGGSGSAGATATPAPAGLAAGLNDALQGSLTRAATRTTATFSDTTDTTLRVVIVANADGSGTLTISRAAQTLCNAAASIAQAVTARCGALTVSVVNIVASQSGAVSGTLVTR